MLAREENALINRWVWISIPGSSAVIMLIASITGHPLAGGSAVVVGLCAMATWWKPEKTRNKRKTIPRPEPRPPVASDTDSLIRQMLDQGRGALLIREQTAKMLDKSQRETAIHALYKEMTLVPAGQVCLKSRPVITHPDRPRDYQVVKIPAYFLDRCAITNEQFHRFVEANGYEQANLWDESVSPGTFEFLDQTGLPGPRFWRDGKYLVNQEQHPVVGISWYEAAAFARWVGKRLPSDPEWVKAATWPIETNDVPKQRRFPWGEEMDPTRANVWISDFGRTLPVTDNIRGVGGGGHHQLVGNVWEWTTDEFGCWDAADARIHSAVDMKSIRGAAYDTYFDHEATGQFQSGEYPLSRRHNIGFRCAISASDVAIDGDLFTVDAEEGAEGEQ